METVAMPLAVPWSPEEVDALLAGQPWPERHAHARLQMECAIHRWHQGGGRHGMSAVVGAHLEAGRGALICPVCGASC